MKKTLLVTLDFYPNIGGVSTYWERLGDHFPSSQWVLLAPRLNRGTQELAAPYTIVRRIFFWRFAIPHWIPLCWHIWRTCRRHNIQRIVIGNILPAGTAAWILSSLLRIPILISAHGFDVAGPRSHARKQWIARHVLHHAQMIVVNSKATASIVKSYGIADAKIQFVYPCPSITPALLKQHAGGDSMTTLARLEQKKILLTVGRLVARKGHAFVLQAMPGILAEMSDVVYCIIGDGPYRGELERLAQTLNIEHSVFFLGTLPSHEVAQWYAACNLFIMTPEDIGGDIEGFGIVYLEAQSFGKPVIGSRVSGVVESVVDGVTGVLVQQRNALEVQRAVTHLLSDADAAKRLGENGRRRVAEEFQWKYQAEKLQYLLSL